MRIGVHLPLADFGGETAGWTELCDYVRLARNIGFSTIAANDHLIWRRPWLDGPTALASVISAAGDMTLATTVTLPAVRHPVVVAKALMALAVLAPGQVVGGLGPGSSGADYAAVGVPFEQRWARFDEGIRMVRALVRGERGTGSNFYPGETVLEPVPDRPPQIWFGSWGSERRLEAMASVADGWLASAYNATPSQYGESRTRLDALLRSAGRDPGEFPDALATAWLYITENRREADEVLTRVLAPVLNRDPESLTHLPIGGAAHCAEALAAYESAGAREVLLWPIRDSIHQLDLCADAADGFFS